MWGDGKVRMPGRPDPAFEVDEELEFHLTMRAEELEGKGLSAKEARSQAEEEFGDIEATRHYCKDQDRFRRRRGKMGGSFRLLRDELILAARTVARRPGAILAPVAILALAVAMNALVLSVVRGVLLAPLPFQDAERVAVLEEQVEGGGYVRAAYPILDAWRRDARQVEALAGYLTPSLPMMVETGPVHVEGALVTEGFFGLLSDPLRNGRSFNQEEHAPGAVPVAAISEGLWERAFGSDPQILGRLLEIHGRQREVVGLVRDEAIFPDGTEVWLPVESEDPDLMEVAGAKIFTTVARLRPGVELGTVGRELGEISAGVEGGAPDAGATWVEDRLLGDVRTPLLLLQGAVLLVLLAAAANAGGLLLARGVRRRGEVALRASLGAGSGRVATGLLMEGLLLGGVAGLGGLILARLSLGPALALVPVDLPRAAQISLDPAVALLALLLAVGTGMATALIPAFSGSRTSPSETLRESTHGGGTPPWIRMALEGLVVAQVALAVVLTAGAGLLIRSFVATVQEEAGFHAEGVTLVDVGLPEYRYPDATSRVGFARELLARAENLSGVEAVALGRNLPISGSNMTSPLMVEGSSGMTEAVQIATVSSGYFDVMEIPFGEGGGFQDADPDDGPPVMVVDLGVRSPEGAPITVGDRAHSFFGSQDFREIQGIVGSVRHRGLRANPVPIAYEPFFQRGGAVGFTLLVRSEAPTAVVAREAREMLGALDPELPVDRISTMDDRIGRSLAEPRFYTVVLSTFGILAILLALAGCQAGLAHRVAARRREVGIRMALGAPSISVRGMILRRGLILTGLGIVLGLAAAVPSTRLLESQLYGVTAGDPLTYGGLLLLVLLSGAIASDLPARQAAALDPADVLREG